MRLPHMLDKPKRIKATLKVVVTEEFYDTDADEETVRQYVEQSLEECGLEADVRLVK